MSSNRGVLADTGFWIALYEPRKDPDQNRKAREIFRSTFVGQWLFPFPLYYEILRTRFVSREDWVREFARDLRTINLLPIDDSPYREAALNFTLNESRGRPISLADALIREVLISRKYRITSVVTTNPRDFNDVCRRARIEMKVINA